MVRSYASLYVCDWTKIQTIRKATTKIPIPGSIDTETDRLTELHCAPPSRLSLVNTREQFWFQFQGSPDCEASCGICAQWHNYYGFTISTHPSIVTALLNVSCLFCFKKTCRYFEQKHNRRSFGPAVMSSEQDRRCGWIITVNICFLFT